MVAKHCGNSCKLVLFLCLFFPMLAQMDMMKAVITGGTKGIGRAIAEKLATNGYELVICSRNAQDLAAAKADLEKLSATTVHTSVVDMSQRAQVLEFGTFCLDKLGQIDILINNAGIFIPGAIHEEEEGALELSLIHISEPTRPY